MRQPSKWMILAATSAMLLAGCGQAGSPLAPRQASSAISAMATSQERDKICQLYLTEYQSLSWNYQTDADRKTQLLGLIAATGSGVALSVLSQEYQSLSWNYQTDADRKKLLMNTINQIMAGTPTPCTTGSVSPAQRDQVCLTYLSEYQSLSWNYQTDSDRKKLLLDTIASTGSDKGIDVMAQEYQSLSWNYQSDATLKTLLLNTISKALSVPTVPCDDKRQGMKAPSPAKRALRQALAGEVDKAPAAQQKLIRAVMAKLPV